MGGYYTPPGANSSLTAAQQAAQDAQAQWNQQGAGVYGGVGSAQDYYGQTQQETNSATDSLANYRPGQTALSRQLANYDPSSYYSGLNGVGNNSGMLSNTGPNAQKAFDPSTYYQGISGARTMYNTQPAAGAGQGVNALAGYDSSALKGFSSADVSNFDPSAAGSTWASGAYGDFSKKLQLNLDKLQNASVAAGRTNTNLFDRDTGRLVNQNANDFSNALAQEAGVFSGQRLQGLTSGAQMRLSAAQGIDTNMLSKAQGMDTNAIRQNEFGASLAQQYDQMNTQADLSQRGQNIGMADNQASLALRRAAGMDQGTFDTANAQANLSQRSQEFNASQKQSAATEQARLGFEKGSALDNAANTRSYQNDQLTFNARNAGLSAALQREAMGQGGAQYAQGRADAYTSATRNWASSDENTQYTRDQQKKATAYAQSQAYNASMAGSKQAQAAQDANKAALGGYPYYAAGASGGGYWG